MFSIIVESWLDVGIYVHIDIAVIDRFKSGFGRTRTPSPTQRYIHEIAYDFEYGEKLSTKTVVAIYGENNDKNITQK
jgi:hypothetical protein